MNHESFCKKVFCLATAIVGTVYVTARITDCLMHHFFQYCSAYLPRAHSSHACSDDLEEAVLDTEDRAESSAAS